MPKRLRFSELVKKLGAPKTATLWTDPRRDSDFQRAVKENRVLTVRQETVGQKKDLGRVGFHQDQNVSYLIFPKPLPKTDGDVVGIKYDLLDEPDVSDPVKVQPRKKSAAKKPAAPREHEFTAVLRRTATWELPIKVHAKNKTEAKKKLKRAADEKKFNEADAVIRVDLRGVAKA